MLREKFSHLMKASVRVLEKRLKGRKCKDFIQDLKRQYRVKNSENMGINELLDIIRIKRNWGYKRYHGLFRILMKYVHEETFKRREKYRDLVIGLHDVKSFFCRYQCVRDRKKYAQSLQVHYKVSPRVIDKIKKLWNEICKRFNLPPLRKLLYDIRYSSLTLTWLIDADEETSTIIRNLLIQHLPANKPFLQEENITHLLYNFEVLYPVSLLHVIAFIPSTLSYLFTQSAGSAQKGLLKIGSILIA